MSNSYPGFELQHFQCFTVEEAELANHVELAQYLIKINLEEEEKEAQPIFLSPGLSAELRQRSSIC